MNKIDWKRKLTSRKFWAMVAEFIAMMIVFCGGSESVAVQITALIMAGAGIVAYIIGEGLADYSSNVSTGILIEENAEATVETDE